MAWWHMAGDAEVWLHSYLTLALGVKWSASRPSDFTAGKDIKYPLNGGLGGPTFQELNLRAPHSLVTVRQYKYDILKHSNSFSANFLRS
jgi:hypothetical protein